MTRWNRPSLGSRIDRLILHSIPGRWLLARSAAEPAVEGSTRRLWPSAAVLAAATLSAAAAWSVAGRPATTLYMTILASCAGLSPLCRLLSGNGISPLRPQRLDASDRAARQSSYRHTYVALLLLAAAGLFALMIEALAGRAPQVVVGIHAGTVIILGCVILNTMPVVMEAAYYRHAGD